MFYTFTILQSIIGNYAFVPELFLGTFILIQILYNLRVDQEADGSKVLLVNSLIVRNIAFILFVTLFLTIVSGVSIEQEIKDDASVFISYLFNFDIRPFILFVSIILLVPIKKSFDLQRLGFNEFYIMYLIVILSSLLIVKAINLIELFILIEIQTLCLYCMSCYTRAKISSGTAGVRYFIVGAFLTAFFVYFLSLNYGLYGNLDYNVMADVLTTFITLEENHMQYLFVVILSGGLMLFLFLKLGVAPFHFWPIDVYDGAAIPSTIVMSIIPKIVFFDILYRLMSQVWLSLAPVLLPMAFVLGFITVLVGSMLAYNEMRLKRFLILSSIPHTGYILIAFGAQEVIGPVFISYLIIYVLNMITAWSFFVLVYNYFLQSGKIVDYEDSEKPLDKETFTNNSVYLSHFKGIYYQDKGLTLLIIIVFFGFSGIPLFTGFIMKFSVFQALTSQSKFFFLALLIITSLINFKYYVNFVQICFQKDDDYVISKDKNPISFADYLSKDNMWSLIILIVFCALFQLLCVFYVDEISVIARVMYDSGNKF